MPLKFRLCLVFVVKMKKIRTGTRATIMAFLEAFKILIPWLEYMCPAAETALYW